MKPETQKKLLELGFTEDKPDHFTLSRCGYTFNVCTKSERFHTIWMTVPCDEGYSVGLPLEDCPKAVKAGMEWFNAFVNLNVGRQKQSETMEKREARHPSRKGEQNEA